MATFGPSVQASVEFGTVVLALVGLMAAGAGATFVVDSALEMGEKGTTTATMAAENKDGALRLLEVRGERGPLGLARLFEIVAPEEAGGPVELDGLVLEIAAKGQAFRFTYASTPRPGAFSAAAIRDVDGSVQATPPVLNEGDLAEVTLELGAAGPVLDVVGTYTQTQVGFGIRTTASTLAVGSGATGDLVRLV